VTTRLIAGVDAGGTATRVALMRDGVELGRAAGRGGAIGSAGAMAAAVAIGDTVRAALAQAGIASARVDVLLVGAAGAGRESARHSLAEALRAERLADRVIVETDAAIALEDAFGAGPGILLSVGTGSIAVARQPDGRMVRAGGWGWQLGDEGGGAWLGREALRAAVRTFDGRADERPLLGALRHAARCADDDALIRWGNAAEAREFAALAPAVLQAAEAGVVSAERLVQQAAEHAAALGLHLAQTTGLRDVALNGGLVATPGYSAVLRAQLASLAVREAPVDALRGALAIAARIAA
jgi:glucosamine kinase